MITRLLRRFKSPFASSLFWGTGSAVLIQGCNFIINIFIARILQSQLGLVSMLASANGILQTISLLGLNVAAVVLVGKEPSEDRRSIIVKNIYFLVLSLSTIVALFVFLLDAFSITSIWKTKDVLLLLFCSIWMVSSTIDMVQISILMGLKSFKDLAVVSFVKGIVLVLILVPLTYIYGVVGLIGGYAIGFSIGLLGNYFYVNKKCVLNLFSFQDVSKREIFKILSAGIPLALAALVISPSLYIANRFIFNQPNGPVFLSIFYIAYQWMVLIQFFPTQIAKVILPYVSEKNSSNKRVKKLGFYMSLVVSMGMMVISVILNKYIIKDVYKFDPALASYPFIIMCIAAFFSTFNMYFGNLIVGAGKYWHRTIADFIIAIIIVSIVVYGFSYLCVATLPYAFLTAYFVATIYLILVEHLPR